MLIVLANPIQFPKHTALAVNANTWESITIQKMNSGVFRLALFKHFDLKVKPDNRDETESAKYYPIAVFDTVEECEQLFEAIVEALENGDKVFSVKKYLEKKRTEKC